jgi:Ca2+-binding RTX toxin-like protein
MTHNSFNKTSTHPLARSVRFIEQWHRRVSKFLSRACQSLDSTSGQIRRSQSRRKLARPLLSNRQLETLEQRLVLAAFTPSIGVPDGDANSLRDVIHQVNSNGEDDVITLSAGTWNMGLSNGNIQDNENLTGDFDLTESHHTVVIEGAGAGETFIDAHGFDRHFQLLENVTFVLRNVSLINGVARDNGFPGTEPHERTATGGSILVELGNVTVDGVEIDGNLAMGALGTVGLDGRRAYGGAIAALDGSTLTITNSSIINNQAKGGEGGEGLNGENGIDGGGGDPDGQKGDDGGSGGNAIGGAVYAEDSDVTIINSNISNNDATGGPAGTGGDGGNGATDGATDGAGGEGGGSGQGGRGYGGALYSDTGTIVITSSIFDANLAIGGNSARGGRGGKGGANSGSGGTENGANGGFSSLGGNAKGGAVYTALGNTTITSSSLTNSLAQAGNGENGGIGGRGGDGGNGFGGNGGNGGPGGEGGVAQGGGLFALRGSLDVTDSTIAQNEIEAGNGGIGGAGGRSGTGDLGGTGGNGAPGGQGGDSLGGGIYSLRVDVTTTNTTVSTNTTDAGIGGAGGDVGSSENGAGGRFGSRGPDGYSEGGGLWLDDATNAILTNTTIAVNEAKDGEGGGVFNVGSPQILLQNTLITLNVNDDDFVGEINSASSNNAIGNGSRSGGIQDGTNDNQIGTTGDILDLLIGPLADNGGPTLTHLLHEGSLAIDAGNALNSPAFDQRGIMRPLQSPVDVGAVEAQRVLSVDLPAGGGQYRLLMDASDLVLKIEAGSDVFRYEHAALLSLTINASDDGDSLIVDFSHGTAVPIEGILFDGTGGSDSLLVTGTTAAAISHEISTEGSGQISIDGQMVRYENVPLVADTVSSVDRSLTFTHDDDTVTIGATVVVGTTSVGHGTSVVTFANPSGTLRVDANSGNDSVIVSNLDAGLLASLTIEGGSGNDVLNAESAGRALIANGGTGDDLITGSQFNDTASGGEGNDSIYGLNGADQITGDAGQDWIFGDGGDDVLSGGDDDDFLFGGSGADAVSGDAGNDSASGQGGSRDSVTGGTGDDILIGGSGDDIVVEYGDTDFVLTTNSLTGLGNDLILQVEKAYLYGGDGDNLIDARGFVGDTFLDGGSGHDVIQGSDYYDVIIGNMGNDVVHANSGPDVVIGGGGHDKINGGQGEDYLRGNGGDDVLNGDDDNDTLVGNDGEDVLNGGLGDDLLRGDENADQLNGDDGNDELNGGDDNDILSGNAGDDVINGDAGDDTAHGNDGADSINGGADRDRLFGDAGADNLSGGDGGDDIHGGADDDVVLGNDGNDWLFGNDGNDAMYGGAGNDAIVGDAGDDFLLGDLGDDALLGGDGNDVMLGSGGNDRLLGQAGNDVLKGQGATDILAGGLGADALLNPDGNDIVDETATYNAGFDPEGGQLTILPTAGTAIFVRDMFDLVYLTVDGIESPDVATVPVANVTRILVRGSSGADSVDLRRVTREMFTSMQTDSVLILGGDGADTLIGTEFRNRIEGGAGDDIVTGGDDPDLILAGAGDDIVEGGRGEDVIFGEAGDDYITGGDNADYIDGGDGNDVLRGRSGNDTIRGNNGNDSIAGHRAKDVVYGDLGNDIIVGGDDDDKLYGGGGDDIVLGDTGNDLVVGQSGTDLLAGGHGFGNPDAGDVVIGDPSEIDETYIQTGDWLEDI